MMRKSTPNWIQSYSGRRFRPLDPSAKDLSWLDGAHALSNICRFTGHCVEFYSVGEHCIYVSRRAEELGAKVSTAHSLYCARWGLIHDLSEAWLTDLAKPLKQQDVFAGYREAEKVLQDLIAVWAGLDIVEPAEVTQADAELLATEASQIMNPELEKDTWYFKYPPVPGLKIQCWEPKVARQQYLNRAKELGML